MANIGAASGVQAGHVANYIFTETGITIVTRDYSLFESPVAVDYFTSE